MQRLSGLDASFLYLETRAQLLHVCGLIKLDAAEMQNQSFETLRSELERRVKAMPGFRRKLHDSIINIDHPVWVEADDFNIDNHLVRLAVPSPGTDKELSALASRLAGQPMDRSMPLWEMYVIEGLADGGVAVLAKMHHATVDGVTGANMMSQLCTLTPEDPSLDEDLVKQNAGGSSAIELAVGGVISRMADPFKFVSLLPGTLGLLPKWISRARKGMAMPAPFTAPRTPFNSTITGHRSISYTTLELEGVKQIKNAFGTTVNDVVLALCSTALRKYLDSLRMLPKKPLIAMVPMSVHAADHRSGTNRVSGMFMSLATDIDDPIERLEAIRDHNTVAKQHNDAIDANLLTDWAQFAAPSVFGSAVRMYSKLRLSERHPVVHNLVISNVPGPDFPLYFLGAKIDKMLPLGPVFHGAGLNCTVMSLDGELHIGFIACRELLEDPWPLAEFVDEAYAEYLAAAGEKPAGEAPAKKTPAKKASRKKKPVAKKASTTTGEVPAENAPARKDPAATTQVAAEKVSPAAMSSPGSADPPKPTGAPPKAAPRPDQTEDM